MSKAEVERNDPISVEKAVQNMMRALKRVPRDEFLDAVGQFLIQLGVEGQRLRAEVEKAREAEKSKAFRAALQTIQAH
jgi:hypothetical protein